MMVDRTVGYFPRPGYALPRRRIEMAFRLVQSRYDRETERAYVELRRPDDDGGEILVTAIFTYRTASRLSIRQIEQDIVRKARHELKRAAAAT
jgi:hypothetical protein